MSYGRLFALLLFGLSGPRAFSAQCVPFQEAGKHLGNIRCITGTVIRVEQGNKGVHYLDFCEDFRVCPFTVVVFARDLKNVGDVRQLKGKVIEIRGPVQEYDGRAEIILRRPAQLGGQAARIPPLPKGYDVERKGQYSAGTMKHPKSRKPERKRQPARVPIEDPAEDAPTSD